MIPAQCMLFYVPGIVSRPFDTDKMYVILCSQFSLLPLWSRHNVCYSTFLILLPIPAIPAQCMLFRVPEFVTCLYIPTTLYVILCFGKRNSFFDQNLRYAILCKSYNVSPFKSWLNVYVPICVFQPSGLCDVFQFNDRGMDSRCSVVPMHIILCSFFVPFIPIMPALFY